MTATYLDLAVKLLGQYRELRPSGIKFFCNDRVLFNEATREIKIGGTVLHFNDFVELIERQWKNGSNKDVIIEQLIADFLTATDTSEHEKLKDADQPDLASAVVIPFKPKPDRDEAERFQAPLEPNRNYAERFLTAFVPTTDRHTYQTFDESKERKKERAEANKLRKQQGKPELKDPFAHIFHGTLAKHWNTLVMLNNKGAGIYFTVCETDLKGRKKNNIKRVRAGFGDLDGSPLDPVNAAEVQPHIVVESSPGRYHPYYIIADDMPLEEFEPLQKAIAARFNGDPSVHDLPRVMRLPGFIHRKDKPFLVRILQINKIAPYPWKVLQEAFLPPPNDHPGRFEVAPAFADLPVEDLGEGIPEHPRQHDLSDRWKQLNSEAIRRYSDWVPAIFPTAHPSNGGYRVSSVDLGRDLQEDLSFHSEGIKDFGVHDIGDPHGGKRTPIDIVKEHLHKDFNEAVRWLAGQLGLDPNDYLPKPKPKDDDQQGSGDVMVDAEITRLAALSTVEYEHERKAEAKKLALRTDTLDKLVTNERAKQAHTKASPQAQAAKTKEERLLAELNRDNSIVLDGARTRVLRFEEVEHDAGGEHYIYRVPTFLRSEDFRLLHLNRHIMVAKRSVDVGSWWLEHPQRQQYPGIIFKPNGEHMINSKLNLWRGWGVTPRRGDWSLLREHIYEVLAARDDDVDAYTINWLGWAVQHADEQAEVALVFKGDRGTGRGTLGKVMCKLFGQHARHISSPTHLTGRFNAHLRQCSFLFADEAYAPDDKSAEGALIPILSLSDRLLPNRVGRWT